VIEQLESGVSVGGGKKIVMNFVLANRLAWWCGGGGGGKENYRGIVYGLMWGVQKAV
jgi:hypothetical protein